MDIKRFKDALYEEWLEKQTSDRKPIVETKKNGIAAKKWTIREGSCLCFLVVDFQFRFLYGFKPQSGVRPSSVVPSFYPSKDE